MSLFQSLGLDFGSRIFFYIIDMDQCLYDPCILLNSPKVKCKVDLPLLTGKVTNHVLDCNSFKALGPFLESLSLQSLEFWVVRQESCQPHIFLKYEQNNHLNCLMMRRYISKSSLIKHTCLCRDKFIILWTLFYIESLLYFVCFYNPWKEKVRSYPSEVKSVECFQK